MMDFLFRTSKDDPPTVYSEGEVEIRGRLALELAALTFTQCLELSRDGRKYQIRLIEDRPAEGKSEVQK